jgi:hypothetical protein
MARSSGRYLWGTTLLDKVEIKNYFQLDTQSSAPTGAVSDAARVYFDGTNLRVSTDGTSWSTVTMT